MPALGGLNMSVTPYVSNTGEALCKLRQQSKRKNFRSCAEAKFAINRAGSKREEARLIRGVNAKSLRENQGSSWGAVVEAESIF